jgi:DNA-directed RNA polymerase subunit H (RpoH/RPB5)
METINSSDYNVYLNTLNYINDLGYITVNKVKKYNDFIKDMQFIGYIDIETVYKSDSTKKWYVFIIKKNITKTDDTIFSKIVKNTFITIVGNFTTILKQNVKYGTKIFKVTYLNNNLFKMDIKSNVMVPKHILCNADEMKKIMNANFVTDPMNFPKIKSTDPQIILIGGVPGQLVKIIRKDDKTGESLYYRYIIN